MKTKPTIADVLFTLLQLSLFVLYFFLPSSIEKGIESIFKVLGAIPMLTGAVILVWAIIELRNNLSIFPSPKEDAILVTSGIYKSIRHPIYAGVILLAIGYSIFLRDFDKMIIALIIMVFFELKTAYEERKLIKRFDNYETYRGSTGKFLPLYINLKRKKTEPELEPELEITNKEPTEEEDEK